MAVKKNDVGADTPARQAERDMQCLRIVYDGLTQNQNLARLETARRTWGRHKTSANTLAVRTAFSEWYTGFYTYVKQRTTGWWGDYPMKCLLDVPCNVKFHKMQDGATLLPDPILSVWPVRCPAYAPGIRSLFRKTCRQMPLKECMKFKLLMHIHARLSKELGADVHNVTSTLAQLCWQKRQR